MTMEYKNASTAGAESPTSDEASDMCHWIHPTNDQGERLTRLYFI